jgi:hypothetical protein
MVYNKETNKSGPNNKCCGSIPTKAWCQHSLAAEVCNTGIIYRHSPQNTYTNYAPFTLQPPLREGGYTNPTGYYNNQHPSLGHAVSCSLDLTISTLTDKFFCTDCFDLNGTYKSYYDGNWHWYFCDQEDKYDKCSISHAVADISYDTNDIYSRGLATWPPASDASRDVYLNLTIKRINTNWHDILPNVTLNNSIPYQSWMPSPQTVYKSSAYLGKVYYTPSLVHGGGYYDSTVNGTGIDVSMVYNPLPYTYSGSVATAVYSGVMFCDWENATVTIRSNNSDNTLLDNEFRIARYLIDNVYDEDNYWKKLCMASCINTPANTGNAQLDYLLIGHGPSQVSQIPSGHPCHSSNSNLVQFHNNEDWNSYYKEYHDPIGYVVKIRNAYPESGCVSLNGDHAVLRNLRGNNTGLIYDKPLYEYDSAPSGMMNPIDCYNCNNYNHTNTTDYYGLENNACIGNIGISDLTMPSVHTTGNVIVKLLSEVYTSYYYPHRVIAAYSGNILYEDLSSFNSFNKEIDLVRLPMTNYSGIDRCDFNHLSVKLSNLSIPDGRLQKPCLPLPVNHLCEGGKLPNAFMVNFPSNWSDGYALFPSYSDDLGTPHYQHIYYIGDVPGTLFGSTCLYYVYSLSSTPPGSPVIDGIYYSTTPKYGNLGSSSSQPDCSGCHARYINCADYPGGYPIGNFLLTKTDYTSDNSTCSIPNDCNGGTTFTQKIESYSNSSGNYVYPGRATYSYWNECSNTPCDWREMRLTIDRGPSASGFSATLNIYYQNWPCTTYESECVQYGTTDGYGGVIGTGVYSPANLCNGRTIGDGTQDPGDPGGPSLIYTATFQGSAPVGINKTIISNGSRTNMNYFDCNNLIVQMSGVSQVVAGTGLNTNNLSDCDYTWTLYDTQPNAPSSPPGCAVGTDYDRYIKQYSGNFSNKYQHPHWNGGNITIEAMYI